MNQLKQINLKDSQINKHNYYQIGSLSCHKRIFIQRVKIILIFLLNFKRCISILVWILGKQIHITTYKRWQKSKQTIF